MKLFNSSTPAETLAKAEVKLADADETLAQAAQALDSARLADLGEHPDARALNVARKAMDAATLARTDAYETAVAARTKHAQSETAAAVELTHQQSKARRQRLAELVKSRTKLAAAIDAQLSSLAEDWAALAAETDEIHRLVGAPGEDLWNQLTSPIRMAGLYVKRAGLHRLPGGVLPIEEPGSVPSFEALVADTGSGLLNRVGAN